MPEALFDIICDVTVGEGDSEIPQVGEEVGHDGSKGAIELCTISGVGHEVDGNGVHGGTFGCIENKLVLPSLLDEVVLWGEEDVWREPGNPGWKWDDKIVALLFLHGFHDRIKFLHDGWVVTVLPIGHEVFLQAVRIGYVWSSGCHDMAVVLQQFTIYVWGDVTNDVVDIPVHSGVVLPKIPHYKACVLVVMEEAGEKRSGLVLVDLGLCGPVRVSHFDPAEVVIGKGCDGLC